jgi:hypothetical protein
MPILDEMMAVVRLYATNPTPHNEFKVRCALRDGAAQDLERQPQVRALMARAFEEGADAMERAAIEAVHEHERGLHAPTDGVKERCPYCRGNGQMQVLDGGKHVEHPCICIYGVVPPSAFEWLSSSTPPSVASLEWMEGWDACRNRARTLLDKHIARGVQEVHHG